MRQRKRRGRNLTEDEKVGVQAQVVDECVGATKNKVPAKIDGILKAAGVAKNYLRQCLNPQAKDKTRKHSFAYQSGNRKPTIFTKQVDEFMLTKMCEECGRASSYGMRWQSRVNDQFNLAPGVSSDSATRKHCMAHAPWVEAYADVLAPLYLTPRHFSDSATRAKKHSKDAVYARVDVDEK